MYKSRYKTEIKQRLKRKKELVALLLLSYGCLVTVNFVWLFLVVSWVGLRCVVVVFPDHIHLLFIACMFAIFPNGQIAPINL